MKVTFLGTGTSQGVPVVACDCEVCRSLNPKDKRLRSSIMVEINDTRIVIDAGPDFRQQMLGAAVKRLDAILLTHEHYDHIAGLDDIRAFNWVQKKPADIFAEERVQQSIKRIFSYVFASKKYPGIPQMKLHNISGRRFKIKGTEVLPVRGWHYKLPVWGFRIENFAYLTDMKTLDATSLEKLRGLDVLVINALRQKEHISHMNLNEALKVVEELTPKKAYLTHISHLMGNVEQLNLPGNVEFAYDGLALYL